MQDAYNSLMDRIAELERKIDANQYAIRRLAELIAKHVEKRPVDPYAEPAPVDVEAERAVIGCVLVNPECWKLVTSELTEGDFGDDRMRLMFGTLSYMVQCGKPIDATLLLGAMRDAKESVGVGDFLTLFNLMPFANQIPYYVSRLQEMAKRRHDFETGLQLQRDALKT